MTPDVRARIFEPFFTTKGLGKGTGLGLSMVHGIVKQSGGGIGVETATGRGATFQIFLPRYVGPATVMRTRPGLVRAPSAHESVLVVEDEDALRNVVKRVLAAEGYNVHTAANAAEALLLCADLGSQIDLVVTDVVMPGMSGREMAERLAPLCSTARVIFMSGYTDETIEPYGVLGQHFLRKPFDIETLAATVRRVLDEVPVTPAEGFPCS
jgi:CheY-like chemotaxis protein